MLFGPWCADMDVMAYTSYKYIMADHIRMPLLYITCYQALMQHILQFILGYFTRHK